MGLMHWTTRNAIGGQVLRYKIQGNVREKAEKCGYGGNEWLHRNGTNKTGRYRCQQRVAQISTEVCKKCQQKITEVLPEGTEKLTGVPRHITDRDANRSLQRCQQNSGANRMGATVPPFPGIPEAVSH